MTQDLLALLPLAVLVLCTALVCEWAARRDWLPYWISRKLLHTVAVGACAVAPLLVAELLHLFYLVLPIWLGLIYLVARGIIMQDEQGRPAWGIVWFPLAYLVLLFFAGENVGLVVFPMAVLAVCDPLATIAGTLFARAYYELTGEEKSQTGNAAFFLGFIFLAGWLLPVLGLDYGRSDFKLLVLLFGVMVTAAEALGSYGRDNLYVPLVTAMLLQRLPSEFLETTSLVIVFLLCIPFIWWTVRRGSLTLGGAVAAGLLAMLVVVFSHWLMLLPLIVFFGSSVLIGRLFPSNVASDSKAGKARDAWQVICNGGVYVLVLFCTSAGLSVEQLLDPFAGGNWNLNQTINWTEADFAIFSLFGWMSQPAFNNLFWLAIPLASLSIATADTWSSEVGQYFRGPTYDILRWKKVAPGLSGGISLMGTIAGLTGAMLIGSLLFVMAMPAFPKYPQSTIFSHFRLFLLVTSIGFLGMLIDSLLGSAFQAKYQGGGAPAPTTLKQKITTSSGLEALDLRDQPQFPGQQPIKGFSWMSNDWVNLLSQLVVVGLLVLLLG
ncbi:MAG: DUF92 domain-containing protein [Bacteroidota bacterium]